MIDLLTLNAGLEVLYCLWRITVAETLVHFTVGNAIDCLYRDDLWVAWNDLDVQYSIFHHKVTGSIVVARFAAFNVGGILSDALPPFQYSVTGFLNTLITACIVILILRYRCAAREAFGENHEMPYLSIMTVLIESASLVVVIDVLAAVGYSQGVLGNIATQVWVPMQVSFRIQFDWCAGVKTRVHF